MNVEKRKAKEKKLNIFLSICSHNIVSPGTPVETGNSTKDITNTYIIKSNII